MTSLRLHRVLSLRPVQLYPAGVLTVHCASCFAIRYPETSTRLQPLTTARQRLSPQYSPSHSRFNRHQQIPAASALLVASVASEPSPRRNALVSCRNSSPQPLVSLVSPGASQTPYLLLVRLRWHALVELDINDVNM
jgi:hypothetical protein